MRLSEIFKLVWLNLSQNKSKVFLTSTGIIVGAATIMLVIAIGTGGKMEVAEQFKNLNAGAIDISYEYTDTGSSGFGGGFPGGNMGGGFPGGNMRGGFPGDRGGSSEGFPGSEEQTNTEKIVLSVSDMEELETFVPGIANTTISYTTKADVDGGELEETTNYTIAGVKSNYAEISNLELAIGDFLTGENDEYKEKSCVLGYSAAKEIFGSMIDAYDALVYIDNRPYVVAGVLSEMGTVASGISPDDAIFIPYETGIKYLTGSDISPSITLVAEEVNEVDQIITYVQEVMAESYPNAEFTITDAGSKMEAASKSNETLTLLLIAMAVIVFIVGGIGIMNVLFVSVKERTNEIGILKAIGCSQKDILLEFLFEASCISLIGAVLGVLVSLGITPIIESFSVRVELSLWGGLLSLAFGVLTGTIFGFYPAYKASVLIPVVALNHE
ncbi:putative ABC transport system permease protein [Kineothrix alysoides]|uniref:Putative ABC transport system permease protein n=1 Tax=Kineothrix alysoides TaxID=1469948 RepID=A0A4R1R5Z8_9FIRM|nr:ABC transporter permease [Kineothrix alysoides]TCL60955.1 putative ABC transport system permease protein [Kineothrix alysoides]